jgi:hypothetical protein
VGDSSLGEIRHWEEERFVAGERGDSLLGEILGEFVTGGDSLLGEIRCWEDSSLGEIHRSGKFAAGGDSSQGEICCWKEGRFIARGDSRGVRRWGDLLLGEGRF